MTSEVLSIDYVVKEHYSRPKSLPKNSFLQYLRVKRIPVLVEEQHAQPFIQNTASSEATDAVVSLIGRLHGHGVILRRLREQWPYNSIKTREMEKYFAFVGRRAVVVAPHEFVLVDDAYLEKYFGKKSENNMERYMGIRNELFFDMSGGLGRFIDPTPREHYQNAERARRAEIYLSSFRKACPRKELTKMYITSLRESAFPQFRGPNYNPFLLR